MKNKIENYQSILMEHYLVVLLLLSLIALTIAGIGSRRMVGLIGCVLCAVAITKGPVKIDLWIIGPMVIYEIFNGLSSLRIYGDVFHGFFNTQIIFPVVYVLVAYLSDQERLWLHRLCALWAGFVSIYGIFQFTHLALTGTISRLEAFLGNPNVLGSFLIVAWFAAKESEPDGSEKGILVEILRRIEPVILTALALTLSMGSFLSMAVGVLVLLTQKSRSCTWNEWVAFTLHMTAKGILGIGPGILLYFTAAMTDIVWISAFIILYLFFLALYWPVFDRFLSAFKWFASIITASGLVSAVGMLLLRTNAADTFIERFHMMRNGLGYLFQNPILGLGPYQWRPLNRVDGDIYFNTWHIHNSILHIGVELGLIAMTMAIIILVRRYRKGGAEIAGFTAFLCHNLIDVSFFYPGITSLAILTTAVPNKSGHPLSRLATGAFFAVFFAIFVCTGFHDAF